MSVSEKVVVALKACGGIADSKMLQRVCGLSKQRLQHARAALERRRIIQRCGAIKSGRHRVYVFALRKARRLSEVGA